MDLNLEGMSEAELKDLLSNAEDYDTRSKIRAALRQRKGGGRKQTGSSVYRRPGFQAPKSVTIPNSVTGNVLASKADISGPSPKPPSKDTPTIGYLGSSTVVTPSQRGARSSTSGASTFESVVPKEKDDRQWWQKSRSSSRSGSQSSSRHGVSSPPATPEPSEEVHSQRRTPDSTSVTSPVSKLTPSFSPEPVREPSPEPIREPSPEPVREPTPSPSPEPVREPTPSPSPEPVREPTPSPSPEPVREPTPSPSPEPVREPTPSPSPEPVREPTPSPSPEPVKEPTPEPEVDLDPEDINRYEEEEEEYLEEEEEEEEREKATSRHHPPVGSKFVGLVPDAFRDAEPGLEEDKDFRKKLRETKDSKINTRASFPEVRGRGAQIDFRDVLRSSGGPEKKKFKTGSQAQMDFRTVLKPATEKVKSPSVECGEEQGEQPQEEPLDVEEVQSPSVNEEAEEVRTPPPRVETPEEESFEARRERRQREREERERQMMEDAPEPVSNGLDRASEEKKATDVSADPDSYEARREARRKAREERLKRAMEEGSNEGKSKLSYRERQARDNAKRVGENRKKWEEKDQANSTSNGTGKTSMTRQKSTGAQRGAQQLLAWCQHKTRYYENVEVNDFSQSWANGLALCAVMHSFVPDNVPYEDLSPGNRKENFTIALNAAEDAGIERFFDVDDLLLVKVPEPKSMMTFLATIYQHFK